MRDPEVQLPDGLYVAEENKRPVTESFVGTLDEIINLAVCADRLGFGWSIQGYHCPTDDDDVQVREYHITAWREVMSETLTWVPAKSGDDQ